MRTRVVKKGREVSVGSVRCSEAFGELKLGGEWRGQDQEQIQADTKAKLGIGGEGHGRKG